MSDVREQAAPSVANRGRSSVQDEVLGRLRHALMVGMLIPGQVISIRKLAALFGTSAMPVRDALAQLVAANALEEMPNRSLCVPVLSRERICDLFEARSALETIAGRRACEREGARLAEALIPINEELVGTIDARRDFHRALEINQSFHFTLYRAAGSSALMPLIESLWLQCGPTLYATLATPNVLVARDQHQRVVDALTAGDAVAVAEAIAHEIAATRDTLLRRFDDLESTRSPLGRLPIRLRD